MVKTEITFFIIITSKLLYIYDKYSKFKIKNQPCPEWAGLIDFVYEPCNIGWYCKPFKAAFNVSDVLVKSQTIEVGFLYGSSCLKGIK